MFVPFFLMIGQTACHVKAHKTLTQTVPSQWLGQNLYENLQESTSSQLQWRVEVILHQGLEVWNLPYQKLQLKHHVSTIVLLDAWASPEKWGIGLVPCLLQIQLRRGYGNYLSLFWSRNWFFRYNYHKGVGWWIEESPDISFQPSFSFLVSQFTLHLWLFLILSITW